MEQHALPSAQNHLPHPTAHYMAHWQHFIAHSLEPVHTNLYGRTSPASLAPTTQWEPSVRRTSIGVHMACTYTAHGQHFTAHGLEPVRTNLHARNSLTSLAPTRKWEPSLHRTALDCTGAFNCIEHGFFLFSALHIQTEHVVEMHKCWVLDSGLTAPLCIGVCPLAWHVVFLWTSAGPHAIVSILVLAFQSSLSDVLSAGIVAQGPLALWFEIKASNLSAAGGPPLDFSCFIIHCLGGK